MELEGRIHSPPPPPSPYEGAMMSLAEAMIGSQVFEILGEIEQSLRYEIDTARLLETTRRLAITERISPLEHFSRLSRIREDGEAFSDIYAERVIALRAESEEEPPIEP